MPDDTATTAIEAATAAARVDILAAIDAAGPAPAGAAPAGPPPVGHGTIRLLDRSDPAPAASPGAAGEPAPAAPEGAGHGRIRLRGSTP
jgi:hypothetical protein